MSFFRKIFGTRTKGKVTYVRTEQKEISGFPATLKYYKADSEDIAISFLEGQNITKQSFFVMVETPEGTFGKDRMGML